MMNNVQYNKTHINHNDKQEKVPLAVPPTPMGVMDRQVVTVNNHPCNR